MVVAGNVTFSHFRAPSFVGTGPSAVDVQGVVLTDETGAQTGAGLRFTPVDGRGVNPVVQCATCGGSKEIVMNAIYQANVTDGAHLLDAVAHPMVASSTGSNAAIYNFTETSFVSLDAVSILTPPLSAALTTCLAATPCAGVTTTAVSAPLSSASPYAFVNEQVQMVIANRRGQQTGRNELTSYDVIFTEVPAP